MKSDLISKIGLVLSMLAGIVYFMTIALDNHNELLFLAVPVSIYVFYKFEKGGEE